MKVAVHSCLFIGVTVIRPCNSFARVGFLFDCMTRGVPFIFFFFLNRRECDDALCKVYTTQKKPRGQVDVRC